MTTRALFIVLAALTFACASRPALSFPPYKSTDADTAEEGTIEARLGAQFASGRGASETLAPRVRLNFGLPHKIEIASEFDYSSTGGKPDDGAMGIKWIPYTSERINVGVEALGLLPVRAGWRGFGTETQLVATVRANPFLLHLNAGGFYDPREKIATSGWRASGLVEVPIEKVRLGVELFAKQPRGAPVDARAGVGMIVDAGKFDFRAGVHAGISAGAPRLIFNLWIARTFSLL